MSLPPAPKKAKRSEVNISRISNESSIVCDDDELDSPFTMYFIRIASADEDAPTREELEIHAQLFRTLTKSGIMPQWIDADEIFEKCEKDNYYVIPMFRGKIFRRLEKEEFRVYGPPIVAECLEEQKSLPISKNPIYSNVFQGTIVAFTMIEKETRSSLWEKLSWMNGEATKNFYREVTHMVAEKADTSSQKYAAATRLGIKLMKKEWIEELWDKTQLTLGQFRANQIDVETTYQMPIFYGTMMTVTRIEGQDRVNITKLVEEHGGTMMGKMPKPTCTHLVTDQMAGEKYKKATEWGTIKIVQTRWVRKCIEVGYMVEESKYHPKYLSNEHLRSSTPRKDGKLSSSVLEHIPDVSSISGQGGKLNSSIQTPTNTDRTPRIFEKMNRSSVIGSTIIENQNETITAKRQKLLIGTNKPTTSFKIIDPIDNIDIGSIDDSSDLFEGCMIFICGVTDESKKDKWRKVLDRAGATRVQKIETATHVVVVAAMPHEKIAIRRIVSKHSDIMVVNAKWIIECFKQNELVPTDEFEWNENNPDETLATQQSTPTTNSRYSEKSAEKMKGIFWPLKFFIHSQSVMEMSDEISMEIEKNGGKIIADPKLADFSVFGSLAPINVILNYDAVVTWLYIKSCVAEEKLLEVSSYALYLPLPQPPTPIFSNFVFALHWTNRELKTFVQKIIELNGGNIIEVGQVQKNDRTLLIIMKSLDISRIDVNERNRTIDLSWIIASIGKCRIQSLDQYLFNGTVLNNYERDDDIWHRFTIAKENTQEINERNEVLDENNLNLTVGEEVVSTNVTKPFKMRLNLDEIHEIIDNLPSPCREGDETMTTSRIGAALKVAVENTGRVTTSSTTATTTSTMKKIEMTKPKPPEGIYRQASEVLATSATKENINETRKTVSSLGGFSRSSDLSKLPNHWSNRIEEEAEKEEKGISSKSISDHHRRIIDEHRSRFGFQPHFVLSYSTLQPEEKIELKETITKLGGAIQEDYTWEATHFICAKLNRTPKTLSFIAAGKWCLTPDYVKRSGEAGEWLNEEDFEWQMMKVSPISTSIERRLAKCCSVWRKRIAMMPITDSVASESRANGAFSGWKCVLHQKDTRVLNMLSILEAGGASVSTVTDYIEVIPKRPNHVFVTKDFEWNEQSALMMKNEQIPLLVYDYIYEYLVNEEVEATKFLHSSMKNCL